MGRLLSLNLIYLDAGWISIQFVSMEMVLAFNPSHSLEVLGTQCQLNREMVLEWVPSIMRGPPYLHYGCE